MFQTSSVDVSLERPSLRKQVTNKHTDVNHAHGGRPRVWPQENANIKSTKMLSSYSKWQMWELPSTSFLQSHNEFIHSEALGIMAVHLMSSLNSHLLVQVLAGWNIRLCLFPLLWLWWFPLSWLALHSIQWTAHTHPVHSRMNNARKNFFHLVECNLFTSNSKLHQETKHSGPAYSWPCTLSETVNNHVCAHTSTYIHTLKCKETKTVWLDVERQIIYLWWWTLQQPNPACRSPEEQRTFNSKEKNLFMLCLSFMFCLVILNPKNNQQKWILAVSYISSHLITMRSYRVV